MTPYHWWVDSYKGAPGEASTKWGKLNLDVAPHRVFIRISSSCGFERFERCTAVNREQTILLDVCLVFLSYQYRQAGR